MQAQPLLNVTCETCGGFGVVNATPRDAEHGTRPIILPCPESDCDAGQERRRAIFSKAMAESEIPDFYANMTFDSFQEALGNHSSDGKLMAYAAAAMFAERRGMPYTLQEALAAQGMSYQAISNHVSNSLMLTGDVGMGKTGLAIAAANRLMEQGVPVLYMRVMDMIDSLQQTYSREYSGSSLQERLVTLITIPVLILDEFEVNNYTHDRLDLIERVIRGRHGKDRPLLATTNIETPEAFKTLWDRRIGDVVATAHWVRVDGWKMRQTNTGVYSL